MFDLNEFLLELDHMYATESERDRGVFEVRSGGSREMVWMVRRC